MLRNKCNKVGEHTNILISFFECFEQLTNYCIFVEFEKEKKQNYVIDK